MGIMTRDGAWEVVKKYVKNENLRRHMLAVEAGMAKYHEYLAINHKSPASACHSPSGTIRSRLMARSSAGRDIRNHIGEKDEWRIVGLLHDFDWEIHPTLEEHPQKGENILADLGVDENLRRTILSHAEHTRVARISLMEKALFAVDELTGLIVATALVKGRKLENVTVESVFKKWKQKSFAAGVNRQDIERGAEDLGVPLTKHIEIVLSGMKEIAAELGL